MASRGQKFKSYSPELKTEILDLYFNQNMSKNSLSKTYGISKGTISTWVHKSKLGMSVTSDNRGKHGKNQNIDYKERYEILKNYQAFLKAQREKK